MDKETAVILEQIKAKQAAAEKSINKLEEEHEEWNKLLKSVIIRTITWILAIASSGILFGWHLSPEARETIIEWISK